MICHDRRFIFIHIQKTGGTSVERALGLSTRDPAKHRNSSELRALYGDEVWARYYKFAFVRNPWDRLASWWSHFDQKTRPQMAQGRPVAPYARYVCENAQSFEDYILNCHAVFEDYNGMKSNRLSQSSYLTEGVDFIGRFERFPEDFAEICAAIGAEKVKLGHFNATDRKPYREFYNDETREIVAEAYAEDIERFGYAF